MDIYGQFILLTDAITENKMIIRVDKIAKIEEDSGVKGSNTCSVRKISFTDNSSCEYVLEDMKYLSDRLLGVKSLYS